MNREQAPLRIHLYPSKSVFRYQHLLHGALMIHSVAAATVYPLAMLPPILWLTLSWGRLFRKTRGSAGRQATLVWKADGSWSIEPAEGESRDHPSLGSCFNLHWLTILGFHEGLFGRRYYLLLADNCDPGQRRRLRARLKQQAADQSLGLKG